MLKCYAPITSASTIRGEESELVDWKTRTAFRSIDELTLRLEN